MNSMTAYGKTDIHRDTLMAFFPTRGSAGQQRKKLWKAEGAAYALAILAHLAVWQLYQAMPTPPPKEEPPIIEATLVVAQSAPAAAPAATPPPPAQTRPPVQPPPKVKPQPKPKPLPKLEKPVVKKPDRPKPIPKPEPEPQAVTAPAPPAPTPVEEEAPPAPVAPHPKPAPKADADEGEDNKYHHGGISGLSSMRYHRLAQERGLEGTVRLKVHILADGDIGDVIVIGSSGHDLLDEYAVESVKGGRATPSRRGDKPIDDWVILPIQFKLQRH